MSERWTQEQAWEWYRGRPWIVGCNYIPRTCINGIEIWQEEGFEQVLRTMDRELAIAAETGLNSVRMVLPYFVWQHQAAGFKQRLERFLAVAEKHGITLMPVLFDDCCVPRALQGRPSFGKQPEPVPGHHGGVVITPFGTSSNIGYHPCDDIEHWPELERFARDIVSTFAKDERILMWDIWNEPGNSNRDSRSLAFMERIFASVRELQPVQPLTAGPWNFPDAFFEAPATLSEIERRSFELSDVITYHYYEDLDRSAALIAWLKQMERPLLITEWLHRPFRNTVQTHLPLFRSEEVGCYHWGLVNGKTQTHEPWDAIRDLPGLDLSLWQHDLYHRDGTPYDGEEIALFRAKSPRR